MEIEMSNLNDSSTYENEFMSRILKAAESTQSAARKLTAIRGVVNLAIFVLVLIIVIVIVIAVIPYMSTIDDTWDAVKDIVDYTEVVDPIIGKVDCWQNFKKGNTLKEKDCPTLYECQMAQKQWLSLDKNERPDCTGLQVSQQKYVYYDKNGELSCVKGMNAVSNGCWFCPAPEDPKD